jgi:hypothetical protein
MAIRDFRLKIKNSDIVGRPLPSQLFAGEPIVNTAEGIMYFSGITTSTPEWTPAGTGGTATFFEVGSNLYDLRLRNRLTEYQGVSGVGLVDKYLKGTSSGFVLDDIANIQGIDSYVTGATFNNSNNILTLTLSEGKPSVTAYVDVVNTTGLTLDHNTELTGLQGGSAGEYYHTTQVIHDALTASTNPSTSNPFATIADITAASGDTQQVKVSANDSTPGYLEDKLTGGTNVTLTTLNDGGNELLKIDVNVADSDIYVTGNTLTPSSNNTPTQSAQLDYNVAPAGGPYFIVTENTFVTGGTLNGSTLTLDYNDSTITGNTIDLSGLDTVDTYVTGFTYNNANSLTISQNQGQSDLSVTINTVTGMTNTGNLDLQGELSNSTGNVVINDNLDITGTTTSWGDILPGAHLTYDLGADGQRWDELWVRKVRIGTTTTTLSEEGGNFEMSGNTGDFVFKPAVDSTFHSDVIPAIDLTYSIGQPAQRWDIYAGNISATGLTIPALSSGRVVYTDGSGGLTTEAGFEYNDTTNLITVGNLAVTNASGTTATIGQGGLVIGSGGSPGNNPGVGDLTIHGNLTVYGTETIVDTTNLYIEDNNITLNYNPTGDTSSTYLGAGFTIQDGDGAGTDIVLATGQLYLNGNINSNSEYTAATGASNLGFFTSMNDILIRNTNNNSGAPDGKRVLAEDDCLDGGTY